MRVPRADEGTVHAFEGVVAASVMLCAAAFVAGYEQPADGATPARKALQLAARDALGVLRATPAPQEGLGTDLLTVLTSRCLAGDCEALTRRLDGLLPLGAAYTLHLSNGYAMHAVHAPHAPPAEAVTASIPFPADWSHTFLAPAVDDVDAAREALVLHALPIEQGRAVTRGGVPLQVTVTGTREADGAGYVLRTAASIDAGSGHTQLHFMRGDAPLAVLDAREDAARAGPGERVSVPLTLRTTEGAGVAVPKGTLLEVQMPRGWTARAAPADGWNILEDAADPNGTRLVARLERELVSGTLDLPLEATYHRDASDAYVLRASLSKGASARASVVILADANPGGGRFESPAAHLTTPGPVGAGSATWTLAALMPRAPTTALSDLVTVTRVELSTLDGTPLFASVRGVDGGGAWSSSPTTLTWTGTAAASPLAPVGLVFEVDTVEPQGRAATRAAFSPSVDLGAFDRDLPDEGAPGLYRLAVASASERYAGYEADERESHVVESATSLRGVPLDGNASYRALARVGFQDAASGSLVQPTSRSVRAGDAVDVLVDVQPLMYQAAHAEVVPTVTLRVYAPWGGSTRAPVHEERLFDGGVYADASEYRALLDADADGDLDASEMGRFWTRVPTSPAWPMGAYVLEVEATWPDALSKGQRADPTPRAARVLDSFDVVNAQGVLPASPLYQAHLVVWMRDWR